MLISSSEMLHRSGAAKIVAPSSRSTLLGVANWLHSNVPSLEGAWRFRK